MLKYLNRVFGEITLITGKSQMKENCTSLITCPLCGHRREEKMPTDACQYFYECWNCKELLKPLPGDCCVYCSYGTVPCPPMQQDMGCC